MKTIYWCKTPGVIANKETGEIPKIPRIDYEYMTVEDWYETFFLLIEEETSLSLEGTEKLEVKYNDFSIGKLILEHTSQFYYLIEKNRVMFTIDSSLSNNEIIITNNNKRVKFVVVG